MIKLFFKYLSNFKNLVWFVLSLFSLTLEEVRILILSSVSVPIYLILFVSFIFIFFLKYLSFKKKRTFVGVINQLEQIEIEDKAPYLKINKNIELLNNCKLENTLIKELINFHSCSQYSSENSYSGYVNSKIPNSPTPHKEYIDFIRGFKDKVK